MKENCRACNPRFRSPVVAYDWYVIVSWGVLALFGLAFWVWVGVISGVL